MPPHFHLSLYTGPSFRLPMLFLFMQHLRPEPKFEILSSLPVLPSIHSAAKNWQISHLKLFLLHLFLPSKPKAPTLILALVVLPNTQLWAFLIRILETDIRFAVPKPQNWWFLSSKVYSSSFSPTGLRIRFLAFKNHQSGPGLLFSSHLHLHPGWRCSPDCSVGSTLPQLYDYVLLLPAFLLLSIEILFILELCFLLKVCMLQKAWGLSLHSHHPWECCSSLCRNCYLATHLVIC